MIYMMIILHIMSSFRNLLTVWPVRPACAFVAGRFGLYRRKITPYGLLEYVAVIILDTTPTAVCKRPCRSFLVCGSEYGNFTGFSWFSCVLGVCLCGRGVVVMIENGSRIDAAATNFHSSVPGLFQCVCIIIG